MKWCEVLSFDETLEFIEKKIVKTIKLKDFPFITENGKWIFKEDGYWTCGFFIGLLWHMYMKNQDQLYKETAYLWLKRLENRKESKIFDLGFLFYPSFVLGYKLTNDKYLKNVAMEAATNLLKLYDSKLQLIYSEYIINNKTIYRSIIDIMMNLSLLWWAFEESGRNEFFNIAYNHSKKTIDLLIRNDFSSIQGVIIDVNKSKIIKKSTFQGINIESCWSRGQAWALHGFILAYKATKEKNFLDTAINLGNYFISNLPKDYIPYWDFNIKEEKDFIKDSSAAAIACSGFIEIYHYADNIRYKKIALKILKSLIRDYLTDEDQDGILKHGTFHLPKGLGIDESLIWGDFYFVEALIKYLKLPK